MPTTIYPPRIHVGMPGEGDNVNWAHLEAEFAFEPKEFTLINLGKTAVMNHLIDPPLVLQRAMPQFERKN